MALADDSLRGLEVTGTVSSFGNSDEGCEPEKSSIKFIRSSLDGESPDLRRLRGESSSKRSKSKLGEWGDRGGNSSFSSSNVARLMIPSASFHSSMD